MGVDIEQSESGLVRPPKINVASKFDRQVDRRSYGDKFSQFENVGN
jgi:troponin T